MKNILLIDIGAGPLPVVTPVPVRQSAWFPVLHTAPPLPTPGGVTTSSVADGILVEWADSGIAGAVYVVSRAPAEAGPYVVVHRTTGLRYLHTDNTGEASWFRVAVDLNGRESGPSAPVVETPVDVSDAIAQSDQAAADALAAAIAADAKAAQEIIDRQTADAILAAELAVARSQIGDIMQADVHDSAKEYPSGDLVQSGSPAKLYRALQDVPVGIAISNTAYWEVIGNYASLGEAVSATAALSTATASELESVSQTVTRHEARMPTGAGALATEARVTGVESAAATATGAVSQRVGIVEGRMPTGTDKLANEARVVTAENASVGRDSALSGRVGTVEARMPTGTDKLANEARVATAEQAAANAAGANAAAITAVSAKQGQSPDNLVLHGNFHDGTTGSWSKGTVFTNPQGLSSLRVALEDGVVYEMPGGQYNWIPAVAGEVFDVSATGIQTASAGLRFYSAQALNTLISDGGAAISGTASPSSKSGTAPTGTKWALVVVAASSTFGYVNGFRVTRRTLTEQQSATAVQTLRADVDSVTGKVNASHSVVLDVNGNVSGTRSENDGTRSSFSILADKFAIVSPSGGARTEYSGGNWRVYDAAGTLRVRMGVW